MHFAWELQLDTQCVYQVYALRSNCNKDAYMHEQKTKGVGKMNICMSRFGIRIGDRKYLNEYTPFGSVSLWSVPMGFFNVTVYDGSGFIQQTEPYNQF